MTKRKPQRATFAILAKWAIGLAAATVLLAAVAVLPEIQAERAIKAGSLEKTDASERVNDYRQTLIQAFGGIAIAIGLYLTYRRISTAEENTSLAQESLKVSRDGQVTERFTRAIDQLGNQSMEIRLGGIYSLAQIARQYAEDYHWTVVEVLSAFLRKHARSAKVLGEDVQAALTAIGRRDSDRDDTFRNQVDLSKCIFAGAFLHRCDLSNTNLTKVDLMGADLRGVLFTDSNLSGAKLEGADLLKAWFRNADLTECDLRGAKNVAADRLCDAETLADCMLDPEDEKAVRALCTAKLGEPSGNSP